ncbi:MAG: AMP-binding protein [Nocardioidaceae bacterium]|nr:AMP-binding protein [Nocardioidaceae bacterium]
MTDSSSPTRVLRAARDLLIAHREDLDTARREFEWPRLEHFNWATDWFDVLAAEQPAHTALWLVEPTGSAPAEALRHTRVSYADMARRSCEVAGWLWSLGVRPGDRVLLVLGNVVPLWELMLACTRLGAVMIPATTLLSRDDLADRVGRGAARVVVAADSAAAGFGDLADGCVRVAVADHTDSTQPAGWQPYGDSEGHAELGQLLADAGERLQPTRADDPLLIYFTSGTTAEPKLVTHTHVSYPVGHLSTMYWLGLQCSDVHLNMSSSGWAKHAWSCFFAPWNAGATVVVHAAPRFEAAALLRVLVECGVTTFCAPPTVWRMLVQEDLTVYRPVLRELVAAGEPLNPEVIDQVRQAWGLTVRDGFGQTETTAQVGNAPGQRVKPGSMGRPLPGYEIVLVDLLTGEVGDDGEVCVELSPRPLAVMTGYLGDEELTAEAMRGGVYHTGDVASRDDDGYLTYIGRADDVFKASDYRVSPFELESVLVEHPAVAEAAVVPSPDPMRMAVPKAFVVLAAGHEPDRDTASSILQHARNRLAPYKRVRILEFAELPKTVSGKIRRVELRRAEADRAARGLGASPATWSEADFPELRTP